MNKAFGEYTEAMRSIAEMAVNLPPEEVDMKLWMCRSKGCILGHAQDRNIIGSAIHYLYGIYDRKLVTAMWRLFGPKVKKSPKQIGYAILNKLKVKHI